MTVTVSTEPKERLRVVVAGAGLCGLSVGMALREFADVTVRLQTISGLMADPREGLVSQRDRRGRNRRT